MKLNQSGLGIVQVLIATAMLGALSLGVMQVSKNMTDVNRNANSSLDFLMLKEEIYSIINDPNDCSNSINDGIEFKKSDIDDKETEGRNIELYLSKLDKTRGKKRFSASDSDYSKYGNIKIKKIKMVLDTPTGTPGGDYPEGNKTDRGWVVVELEKADGKDLKFEIPTKVEVVTNSTNNSKLTKCVGLNESQSANEKLLVLHSQDDSIYPDCPPGWISEKTGYSFIMTSIHPGRVSTQDLADPGSCVDKFGASIQIECEKTANKCDYITGDDFTVWLLGAGTGSSVTPSVCRVCSKINGVVKVVHSQTRFNPNCPPNTSPVYFGYSFMGASTGNNVTASFRLMVQAPA